MSPAVRGGAPGGQEDRLICIGINLSARTGLNTTTGYLFRFVSDGRLCGTDAYWDQATRIVGKGP